jgi:hypothetical protein
MQEVLEEEEERNTRFVRELLAQQKDLPEYTGALRWSAEHGYGEAVRLLLTDGRAVPLAYWGNAFYCAASKNYVEVVRHFLADPRVDPSTENNWVVCVAAWDGSADVLELLLADPRVNATSAVPNARKNCVRLLAVDERFGIARNRDLYTKHHHLIVDQYDSMISQCLTMAWLARGIRTRDVSSPQAATNTSVALAKRLGPPWSDIVWPLSDRLKAGCFEQLDE